MKKHLKHAKITRLDTGFFHRNEYAILGTPCGNIKKLAYQITASIKDDLRVGYVDADHKGADENTIEPGALGHGASAEYIDKIHFHRFDVNLPLNEFDYKQQFSAQDLVLVNGNHFNSKNQIIVIDSKKPLEKKLEKLTNVMMVLFQEGETTIPKFLDDAIEDIHQLPAFKINDVEAIASFIRESINSNTALLNGLVLAGGKSERMNRDKGKINYHGTEQRLFMHNLLSGLTDSCFLSIRNDQKNELPPNLPTVEDVYYGLGPYGAILSAFQKNPNVAWLVTACDQPLLNEETLQLLVSKRNTSKLATAFFNSETNFPEPLVTIWEPRAYPRLLYFLSLGYSCPRKVLINSEVEIVKLEDESALQNANTPEESEKLALAINN